MQIKLKVPHFDTTEEIEAESQAMLNTLTKDYFQDTLTNGRNAGICAFARKGTTLRVMVANMHKVNLLPASVPEMWMSLCLG